MRNIEPLDISASDVTGQKVVNQMPGVIQHAANLSGVMMEQNRANLEQALGKKSTTRPRR